MTDVKAFIADNAAAVGIGAAGAIAGLGVGALVGAAVSRNSSKRKKRSKHKVSRKRSSTNRRRKLKFGSKAYRKRYLKQRKPHTAGKRKDTSHRRIRFTKNNQPYIIMGNGRARFIKKSSVKRSRKLKGGRY